jgi:hypothetical protein
LIDLRHVPISIFFQTGIWINWFYFGGTAIHDRKKNDYAYETTKNDIFIHELIFLNNLL